jgi:hypothetical protein
MKRFTDSQQTDYTTDHGYSYADIETLKAIFKGKACTHSCPDVSLGDSNSKYG